MGLGVHWWLLQAAAAAVVHASLAPGQLAFLGTGDESRDLGDVAQTCDVEAVQVANIRQLHPILQDLVNTTFFRLFRVNLQRPSCPFWKAADGETEAGEHAGGSTCGGGGAAAGGLPFMQFSPSSAEPAEPPCSIDAEEGDADETTSIEEDDKLDRTMTKAEQIASEKRDNESDTTCEFEEDLPTYWVDMCSGDSTKGVELEDVNLIKNPERNTGYNGSHIWEAMYKENCFEVGSGLPRGRFGMGSSMCYEERVLYRLLSGWHASTTLSIVKNFYAPGTKQKGVWSPNPERYMETLGRDPERLKNLHFSFVVMLRAIKKAVPFLHAYTYSTGDGKEDRITKSLMQRLLDSQVLSLCSPLFDAFDETSLFRGTSREQRSQLKRQFKSVFQNITVLVDCVQCQRCRLHAKLFSLGLGTALKILLTPPELMASTTSRDEVVALVNVLWKLSESMEDARFLSELYWREYTERSSAAHQQQQPPPSPVKEALPAQTAPSQRPSSGPSYPAGTAVLPGWQPEEPRNRLLSEAIRATRLAAAKGSLSAADELRLLQSLVSQPAEGVLLLAQHYAADQPELFVAVALEAAKASGRAVVTVPATVPPAELGSSGAPADTIVIGGGLAGMVTALTMLDRGARVVLVDKQPYLGGNSGKASSGINAALETSVESLVADTTKSAGVLARPDLIWALANDSSQAVSWLRDRTGVDLSMRSQLGGHTVKRTLRPSNAFVGAELTFALSQILSKTAKEQPNHLRLLTKSKWTGLERGDTGWRAAVQVNGSQLLLQAATVVIASGGFGHDKSEQESLLLNNRPDLDGFPTTLGPQTTGDGVKIARDLGARLVDMDRVQLHPTGFVDPTKPTEHTKTLAAELLRGVGGLLLDRHGHRFTNELGTRQAVVNGELKAAAQGTDLPAPAPPRTFTMVLNGKAAAMADRHTTLYTKKGLLVHVRGVAALAAHLGLSAESLSETFKSYNAAAVAGVDEFNRTVFPAGHWPIELEEDFYVGSITPVIHYTMGGVAIDPQGRVLQAQNGQPFEGLFAVGEASGGVHGDNRLAGNSLLECTVFGRRVGLSLPMLSATPITERKAPEAPVEAPKPQPVPARSTVTLAELKEHGPGAQAKWVALYGKVYDLTDYVEEHPGGEEAILDVAGMDGTEKFAAVHNKELLESMGFEPLGDLES